MSAPAAAAVCSSATTVKPAAAPASAAAETISIVDGNDACHRTSKLLEPLRLDLDRQVAAGRARRARDRRAHAAGQPDVVVLDQDGVVQADAMVGAAAARAPRTSRARAASAWSCACRGS